MADAAPPGSARAERDRAGSWGEGREALPRSERAGPITPLAAWLAAARPRTLSASVVPVAVGSALAWREGHFAALPAAAALAGALLIQVGTNLVNDARDFERGADGAARLGPPRASQQGWLAPASVLRGGLLCFALAALVGVYLVSVGGAPILILGVVSIAAGYGYTGGPWPLAYVGLGDVFVFLFFGLAAVAGTAFLLTGAVSPVALVAGGAVGALGVALLAVNNTRDAETDAAAQKRTLVVRFGVGFGRAEYAAMLALAFVAPALLWATGLGSRWALLPLLAAPLALRPLRVVWRLTGAALNLALADTARLLLVFGLLLAAGLSR